MPYQKLFTILMLGAGVLAARPVAQEPVAGAWRLAQVGGRDLPVVVEEGGGCREELLAATLTLAPDGRWTLASTERETCRGRTTEEREEERGRYTVQGRAVTFDARRAGADDDPAEPGDDDPAGERDAPGETEIEALVSGTVADGALSVRLSNGVVAVFRR